MPPELIQARKIIGVLSLAAVSAVVAKLGYHALKTAAAYIAKHGLGRTLFEFSGAGLASRAARWLLRKASKKSCGCFAAATLVWTPAGAVPISEIDQGTMVFAAPDDARVVDVQAGEVSNLIVIGEASLLKLAVRHADGSVEVVNTTDEHPFHNATTDEWTRADALQPGDLLSALSGDAEVVSLTYDGERVPVYNLSIPDSPTYYVGERGMWVHNASSPCLPWLEQLRASGASIFNTQIWYERVVRNLVKNHGGNEHRLSDAIHDFKRREGLGGADNLLEPLNNPHSSS